MSKSDFRIAAVALTCLAALVRIGDALAACEPKVENIEAAPAGESTLKFIAMDPAVGAAVNKETVLTIDVEYRVAEFAPNSVHLAPLFFTATSRSVSPQVDGQELHLPIESASGRLRFCLALAALYEDESVSWPLRLRLLLLREAEGGGSRGIASTGKLELNTVDIPASALERQAKAPPPEYEDALGAAFTHFEARNARYQACIRRFPPMQPTLTKAFRSWEKRHATDIEFVSAVKFEAIKRDVNGRDDVAAKIYDLTREGNLEQFMKMPADDLKFGCEGMIEQMAAANDTTNEAIGGYLATLRKWHAQERK